MISQKTRSVFQVQRLERLVSPSSFALTSAVVWGAWGVTRAIMLLNLIIGHHYCDPQFFQYAGDLAQGRLPYIAVPVEYPPFAMLLLLLPALPLLPFGNIAPQPTTLAHPLTATSLRYGAYGISFAVMMLIIDAATLILVMRTARRWTPGDRSGRISGMLYTFLAFGSGALLQKFDLVTGTLCLLAVMLLLERRDSWAWATLMLAVLTKGYPILLAPVFILWRMPTLQPDWVALRRAAIGSATVMAILVGPVMLVSGIAPLVHAITYHADRGIEIESTWATLMMSVAWLPGLHATSWFNVADLSRDLSSPVGFIATRLAVPLTIIFSVLACVQLWYRLRMGRISGTWEEMREQTGNAAPATYLLIATTMIIMVFVLTFRALPAHYLLAVLPLAAVIRLPAPAQRWWLGILVASLIVGQIVVSYWSGLVALQAIPVVLLITRNLLLCLACFALFRSPSLLKRMASERI